MARLALWAGLPVARLEVEGPVGPTEGEGRLVGSTGEVDVGAMFLDDQAEDHRFSCGPTTHAPRGRDRCVVSYVGNNVG
jgi:hypothetical protein